MSEPIHEATVMSGILRDIAKRLSEVAWALEEAESAERKDGVYRIGLHKAFSEAENAQRLLKAATCVYALVPTIAALQDKGYLGPANAGIVEQVTQLRRQQDAMTEASGSTSH